MSQEQYEKCRATMFKKGDVPANHMEVGEYTHTTDGYLIRKVKETGPQWERFEFVHRAAWEEHNGPVPEGKMVSFLDGKVDGLREDQERMKQANKAIRMKDKEKGDATLHDMGYTDEQIAKLREPDFCGRIGFPDYMLANNNANIRRLKGRIKSLQKTKSQGTQESENKFFKVKENVEAMRIQLFFEGKPEPEVRDILKSNGFRWAPSVGAWQRQLNNNGKYAVERVIRELEEMEAAE